MSMFVGGCRERKTVVIDLRQIDLFAISANISIMSLSAFPSRVLWFLSGAVLSPTPRRGWLDIEDRLRLIIIDQNEIRNPFLFLPANVPVSRQHPSCRSTDASSIEPHSTKLDPVRKMGRRKTRPITPCRHRLLECLHGRIVHAARRGWTD